jgi:FkbM family methyltransferase
MRPMDELRQHLRRYVDRLPAVGTAFRRARHAWALRNDRSRPTPFGFGFVGNEAMVRGEFEPAETAALVRMFQTADVFVDVGANVGFYSCLAASRGIHTVAVEPLTDNLDFLFKNVDHNGLADRVEVYPVGVGSSFGLSRIYGWNTGASLLPGWAGVGRSFYRTIPVTQLDVLVGERFRGKRLVIKVDVEGAELEVLKGAATTLNLFPKPRWLMEICLTENYPLGEVNPHFVQTFEIFLAHGYEARTVGREERLVGREDVRRWAHGARRDFGSHNFIFGTPTS